jgi:hypothetical protein
MKIRLFSALVLCFEIATQAAHFTTTTAQPIGKNWNEPIWDPGPTVPTAGNTYEVLQNGLVRNPTVATSTFSGDSLQLDGASILRMKPPADGITTTVNFPGVNGALGLILNGGGVDPGSPNTTFVVAGKILVAADSFLLGPTVDSNRNLIITASLSGTGSITVQNFFNNSGATIRSVSNDFSGNWIVTAGRLTGSGANSLGSGNIYIAAGSRLEILYNIQTPGALALDGVMSLTSDCQFSSAIINGTSLTNGVYSYNDLKTKFPANLAAGGSGSITVVAPDVSLSFLRNGTSLSLQFQTSVGHKYTIQNAPSLDDPAAWTNAASISGDGSITFVSVVPSAAAMFFRVMVE